MLTIHTLGSKHYMHFHMPDAGSDTEASSNIDTNWGFSSFFFMRSIKILKSMGTIPNYFYLSTY